MTSNRNAPGVFDATGASKTVVLAPGEAVPDLSTGQYRLGDGITPGGLPQVAQFPKNPASVLQSNYDAHSAGFAQRFYDSGNNRLYPFRGLGPDNAGCPDTSLPDGSGNKMSPWMWGMAVRHLAERVRQKNTPTALARVTNAWAYFKTQFSGAQLTSTTYGTNQIYGLADDAALMTNVFMDIFEVAADTSALALAIEAFAVAYIMFRDTRSQNPIVTYNASTPGGLGLQRNTYGIQYDQSKGLVDGSTSHEIFLGICAWRIAQVPTATLAALYSSNGTASATALQAALLQMAADTWTWATTYLRFGGSTQAVAGIYGSCYLLGPSDPNYHTIQFITSAPTTKRGQTAFADHGTMAAGVLSDMLYATTGAAKYLTEFQSVLAAYPTQTTGFGRTWNGLPCLVNAQDPWTDWLWVPTLVRRTLARFPVPTTSGVPYAYSPLFWAIMGAAKFTAAQSGNGQISPNSGPPELSGGFGNFVWEQDSMNIPGQGGGNQADGRQVTTAANGMLLLAGGALLAGAESIIGSGMSAAMVDIMVSALATSLASQESGRLRGIRTYDHYSMRPTKQDGAVRHYLSEKEALRLSPAGVDIWNAATTHGDHYFQGNVIVPNQGVQVLTNIYGSQFYLGSPGGYAGLNFAVGSYVSGGSGFANIVAGNTLIAQGTSNSFTVNGQLIVGAEIDPTSNNVLSIGNPSLRWAGIYLGNQPNVASDERLKQDATAYTPAEIACARAVAGVLLRYRNTDAVQEKGDRARWQNGVLAQQVVQLMQDHGLVTAPAGGGIATDIPYTFVGHDIIPARAAVPAVTAVEEVSHLEDVVLPDGSAGTRLVIDQPGVPASPAIPAVEAGDIYTVRYEALLVWIAAAHEAGLTALEARVTALESAHAQ